MTKRCSSISILCLSSLLFVASMYAEVDERTVIRLLRDSIYFYFDLSVISPETSEVLWGTVVNKISIPGRTVSVALEGMDSKLDMQFTVYPGEYDAMILAAQGETWVGEEYSRALTTFPIQYGKELYYYPLGRVGDARGKDPVEVVVKIVVRSYLKTLDEESRAELEASIDSEIKFDLSEER